MSFYCWDKVQTTDFSFKCCRKNIAHAPTTRRMYAFSILPRGKIDRGNWMAVSSTQQHTLPQV
jgi:hypothetical protein